MAKKIFIGGRIESAEVGGVVTGAKDILDDTKQKKQNVINKETDDELARLESAKQNNLTFDNAPTENSTNPVTSGGVYTADKALSDAIEAILLLIPSAATALNQLADKAFVNSSVSTATATFRGTSAAGLTEEQFLAWANGLTHDLNDYVFWQTVDAAGNTQFKRYKWNGTEWLYEYTLNNSSFTADQWAAINSTITLALVQKLAALPTNAELLQALGLKQDVLTFDNAPTSGSSNPVKSGGVYTAISNEATLRGEEDTRLAGLISDEKTRAENAEGALDGRLTTMEGSVGNIEVVIPSAATANNKLVDNNSLVAYVAAIVTNMDATFNVQSTDGHVTLQVIQVDGAITSVQVTTSDIASAADLTLLAGRVTSAEGNITSLTTRMGTAETDIATLRALYNALQQSAPQVIEPTDTWPVANPSTTVIYRVIDRVNTPPEYYSDYMWNGTAFALMATYNNAIDTTPKKDSANLITSGGVFDLGETKVSKSSTNLYDINSIERGYYLNSEGNKNYSSGWINQRGLLKVYWGDNTKLTMNCCGADNGAYVCQFDSDNNFIEGSSQGGLDTSVTITKASGASYVYLEVYRTNASENQINFGESLGEYTEYNPIDGYLNGVKKQLSEKVDKYSLNLFQESLVEWGYWISSSGEKNYNASWVGSRGLVKIYWGNNTKLIVNCAYAAGGTYTAQYDKNGDYIADSKVAGTDIQIYTKVEGAEYIYVAIKKSTPNKQFVFGESLLDPYIPYNPISGYIPGIKPALLPSTKHLYANSDEGTDDATHFFGLSAIQNAINAVPEQSTDNYIIHVKGAYYFDDPSKFYNAPDYNEYYYGFYISPSKRNITIAGEGIERTKVVGCLADNLGSSFGYDKYITAEVLGDNCKVIGVTISAQNMRYAVHLDRSGYSYCNNYHITYENCKLTHQGNTGDAATVWGATPQSFGLGISDGMTVTMKECHFEKKGGTALYCHDNRNFEKPYLLEFISCNIITKGTPLLTFENLGSNVNGVIKLTGTHNYYGGTILAKLTNSGLNVSDYGIPLTRIVSDNPARLFYQQQDSNNNGRVLKFTAAAVGQSVRIYDTYSGFGTLIKGKYGYNGNSFSGIVESDGYRYLDGASDYAGWAMGLKALDIGTDGSIQKRLGDCSSTNVKLSVGLVGQTAQEIVFNKDYTDYSDADMLDEINSQLTGIKAELYWLAMDYYPETPSLLICENNTSGVTIKKGMGVHVDNGYVTKATSNDEVDGIALDDIKYGCWGRIIKKAILNTSYYDYNVVLIENDSKQYSASSKFSIGTTPGIFVRDDTNGILHAHNYSNIIVEL